MHRKTNFVTFTFAFLAICAVVGSVAAGVRDGDYSGVPFALLVTIIVIAPLNSPRITHMLVIVLSFPLGIFELIQAAAFGTRISRESPVLGVLVGGAYLFMGCYAVYKLRKST